METQKKQKQKLRKSRLLSSTKGVENLIELQTLVQRKSRKSKPRKSRNAFDALLSLEHFFYESVFTFSICLVYTLAHWKWSSNIPSLFFSTFVYYIIRYNVHRPFGVQMHNFSVKCRFKATKKCKKSWPIALVMSF